MVQVINLFIFFLTFFFKYSLSQLYSLNEIISTNQITFKLYENKTNLNIKQNLLIIGTKTKKNNQLYSQLGYYYNFISYYFILF